MEIPGAEICKKCGEQKVFHNTYVNKIDKDGEMVSVKVCLTCGHKQGRI